MNAFEITDELSAEGSAARVKVFALTCPPILCI